MTTLRSFGAAARLSEDALPEVLLFAVLTLFALLTPAQNDTFWHLRSGRQMWETRSVLTSEPFSYTAAGTPLRNHWWLSQLAFFFLYRAGGPVLLTVSAGACAFAAIVGSYRLVRGPLEVRLALLAFLAVMTAGEWAVRPQVVSLALLVLIAHLIQRDRTRWLPIVCLLWANAHAMVVFGVVMAGACALEAAVWTRRFLVRDALVTCACIAAPTVSPLGLHYWPQVLATVSTSRELEIQEYLMPLRLDDIPFWLTLAVLGFLAVRRWSMLRDQPRPDRILLIAAAVLGVAAVGAERNVAFFAVIVAPVLPRLWGVADRPLGRRRPAGAVGYGLLAMAIAAGTIVVVAKWQNGGSALGWRPISSSAIQAVRECPQPMFNHFEDGGYLMWAIPERRVFIDSRIEAYPPELFRLSRAADVSGDYRDLFRQYQIACALVKTRSALDVKLRTDGMHVAYSDPSRTVFLTRHTGRVP